MIFRTIDTYVTTSTFSYVFSKSKKSRLFTFFCRVSYVFSNYDPRQYWRLILSSSLIYSFVHSFARQYYSKSRAQIGMKSAG